jgi:hypothetical protein
MGMIRATGVTHTLLALVIGAAAGCLSGRVRPPADCPPPADRAALPDSGAVAGLAGRYLLVDVTTARGYGGGVARGQLALARPDSASEVVERRGLGGSVRRVWRPLVGRYEAVHDAAVYGTPAEMGRAGFTLGCVECLDASPTYYRITQITSWGFTGRWINYQTGIGTYLDRRGRRLPDPEGFFCARRLGT